MTFTVKTVHYRELDENTEIWFGRVFDILARAELEQLDAVPSEERKLHFFKLWCLKEAFVKARGVGFHQKPTSFTILLDNADDPRVTTSGSPSAGASSRKDPYRFTIFQPDQNHLLAAAHQLREAHPIGFKIRDFSALSTYG